MKRKHKRLTFVAVGVGLLSLAAALFLSAIGDSVAFFHSPSDLANHGDLGDRRIRVGGLVEDGSVQRGQGAEVRFRVTDLAQSVPVVYVGILPDLFREGQGVVAQGRLRDGVFVADEVLARHDETYMPPEVAESLKQAGTWQHMEAAGAASMPADGY
ncbi:MAG: cytochrome c maturation protein CcmE [Rhodospirillales bacterium]|nr:MAG: cytochrome c maturation protein CcmE [Rhodospirillales bacterium]